MVEIAHIVDCFLNLKTVFRNPALDPSEMRFDFPDLVRIRFICPYRAGELYAFVFKIKRSQKHWNSAFESYVIKSCFQMPDLFSGSLRCQTQIKTLVG